MERGSEEGEGSCDVEGVVGEVEDGRGLRLKTLGFGFDSVSAESSRRKEFSSWSACSSRVSGFEDVEVGGFEGVDWDGIGFVV